MGAESRGGLQRQDGVGFPELVRPTRLGNPKKD